VHKPEEQQTSSSVHQCSLYVRILMTTWLVHISDWHVLGHTVFTTIQPHNVLYAQCTIRTAAHRMLVSVQCHRYLNKKVRIDNKVCCLGDHLLFTASSQQG